MQPNLCLAVSHINVRKLVKEFREDEEVAGKEAALGKHSRCRPTFGLEAETTLSLELSDYNHTDAAPPPNWSSTML